MSADVQRRYFVEAAAKALDVLESFNGFQETLTISEIVRRADLNYCSAFRLLYTLEKRGYVTKAEGAKKYRLAAPRKRFRIGYAGLGRDCPYSEEVSRSIVLAARALGVDLVIHDNAFSAPKALANLDAMLDSRVHLVIEHQGADGAADLISSKCCMAGVPLLAIDYPHPGAHYFGADYRLAGRLSGEFLAQFAGRRGSEPDRLFVLPPRGMRPARKAYLEGLREGLASMAKESEVLLPAGPGASDGYRAMKQALQGSASRNTVLAAAASDGFAIGCGRAVAKAGPPPEAAIVGLGGSQEARAQLMRETVHASVACFPETYGERAISIALRILQGEQAPLVSYTQHVVLTKANLEQYYPAVSRRPRAASQASSHVEAIQCAG